MRRWDGEGLLVDGLGGDGMVRGCCSVEGVGGDGMVRGCW